MLWSKDAFSGSQHPMSRSQSNVLGLFMLYLRKQSTATYQKPPMVSPRICQCSLWVGWTFRHTLAVDKTRLGYCACSYPAHLTNWLHAAPPPLVKLYTCITIQNAFSNERISLTPTPQDKIHAETLRLKLVAKFNFTFIWEISENRPPAHTADHKAKIDWISTRAVEKWV